MYQMQDQVSTSKSKQLETQSWKMLQGKLSQQNMVWNKLSNGVAWGEAAKQKAAKEAQHPSKT